MNAKYRLRLPRSLLPKSAETGAGALLGLAFSSLGISPCSGCKRRARKLDKLLVFEPRSAPSRRKDRR